MKGLNAYVFKSATFGDSSNGGVSASHDKVFVVGSDSVPLESYIDGSPYPVVRLTRNTFGDVVAQPVAARPAGAVGPMFGGAFIHTSDSRFSKATGVYGAIPLHDRYETAEQHAYNSV